MADRRIIDFSAETGISATDLLLLSDPSANYTKITMQQLINFMSANLSAAKRAICDTAADTASKAVTISNYAAIGGRFVTVTFTNDVLTGAALSVNAIGNVPIYYHGQAITDGVINAGDTALFVYNAAGANATYDLITVDRAEQTGSELPALASGDAGKVLGVVESGSSREFALLTLSMALFGGGFGTCASALNTAAKIVQINGFQRAQGVPFAVKFTNGAKNGDTLNVRSSSSSGSGTGAASLYYNGAAIPNGLIGAGAVATLYYDGSNYSVLTVDGVDDGFGVCSGNGTARTVTITGLSVRTGTRISVRFDTYDVPASATLNVNSYGAKAIRKDGAAIAAGVISTGDVATFVYDGTYWQLAGVMPANPASGGDSTTEIIRMSMGSSGPVASKTASEISQLVGDDPSNVVLIDLSGRECALCVKPVPGVFYSPAKFYTLDEANAAIIIYSVADTTGEVTIDQISIGGSGGGSTTLPQLGGGYAADSVSGSTVARSVTISGFVRTVGNGPTIKYTNEISAKNPTLNVNDGTDDTGAADIWYCGSALRPGTIRAGALVKYVYDGTHYCVESIDERPVIQLVPNNGVVSISGTYQALIGKLKGAAVPQIICLSPNASAQNMEILELRHVWSNDTTSEIKLAGRLGGIEYYVVLSQSGSSGSEVMSGTLESVNIAPDVIMQNSPQPTIAIRNNELHDCGTVTRIYISSWPADGDWGLEFSSSSPATELVWAGNHPTWPDGMTSFVPETGKHYELNVHNGKALIGVWPA